MAKRFISATVVPSPSPFSSLVLKGQTRSHKDYDSPRGLCTRQTYYFPRVTSLLRIQALFTVRHVFFYLMCFWVSRKPITSVLFKFGAKEVEASVVIQVANLKFVAESRTRVYFAQHVASTCNIVFCCETRW